MADFDTVLPPLATLVAFEAAFRHRNFTRAADELFQSQTTVSRRVRELEADLGVRLFDRHRYDATPTEHAEELITSVRLALSELAATAERIRRASSGDQTLTVLSSLALTSAMVVPAVSAFQREHPDIDVRVVSVCEPIETTRERFDVAVQYGPLVSERFAVHVIADEAVFPVCSPDFAARLPDPLTLEALGRLPLIDVSYEEPTWMTWRLFFETFEALPAYAGAKLTMNSYAASLDVAERGDGVAIGWERSVGTRIEAGTLVEIPGLRPPQSNPINAYLPSTPSPHVSRFIELLEATRHRDTLLSAHEPGEARGGPRRNGTGPVRWRTARQRWTSLSAATRPTAPLAEGPLGRIPSSISLDRLLSDARATTVPLSGPGSSM